MGLSTVYDFETGAEIFIFPTLQMRRPDSFVKKPFKWVCSTENEMIKLFEKTNKGDGQMDTTYYSPEWGALSEAVVELAIKDYRTKYHEIRKDKSISHEEAVWMLKPEFEKFFLESPFCEYIVHDMDGEEIYYTLQAELKKGRL